MRRAFLLLIPAAVLGLLVPVSPGSRPLPANAPAAAATAADTSVRGIRVEVRRNVAPEPAVPVVEPALAQELFRLTNAARASEGLAPLRWWRGAVGPAARTQTDRMVAENRLFHTPDLTGLLYTLRAQTVGENVGLGPNVGAIHRAFMKSTNHRGNILSPEYRLGAVYAVRHPAGGVYVTVIFGRALAPPAAR